MNTSELLVLIFVFLVGYMLFKRCGCTEGINGDGDGDYYGDDVSTMQNLITNTINKCNTGARAFCHPLGSDEAISGCNQTDESALQAQLNKVVDAAIHYGRSNCK